MKNVVIKSLVITACIILTLCLAFFAILHFCFPSVLANAAFNTGNKTVCLYYSEKTYEKNEDIESLNILVKRCFWAENDIKTVKYAEILISKSDYPDFLNNLNDSTEYNYYIVGSFVESLYNLGQKEKAVAVAFDNTSVYTETNPVGVVIICSAEKNDKITLNKILSELNKLEENSVIIEYKKEINRILQN